MSFFSLILYLRDVIIMETQTIEQRLKRDLTIGDVLEQYPAAAPLLTEKGIHCVGCHVSPFETLEEGFRSHGMSEEEIDTVIADVNEKLDTALKNPEHQAARAPTVCSGDESLEVSCGAVAKVLDLMTKEGKDTAKTALRIAVLPGGCSGMTYDFSFDIDGKQPDDKVIEKDGLTVLVDSKSLGILDGSRVDYIETLHGAGFVVKNPQAKGGCGCGKSFN